ncbi:hypothetical protein PHLCEN_2v12868 [Hermanssonia centrifuga]|uniref:Uncharacterized protein n=1 Tax=Hermanssonia centrifuga TaxID=98765 RepID=A0A2R6NFP9_9APHY|nr:hypothetical protein PHLCEN_2v12868 [Hermanssonia centrifuga]
MQFKLGFIALASVLSAVVAAPSNIELEQRSAQVDGHCYICTDDYWGGSCTNYGFYSGQCSNFPSSFQDDISSAGCDSGWNCVFFLDYNCNNDESSLPIGNPGYAALGWGNDALSSLRCTRS